MRNTGFSLKVVFSGVSTHFRGGVVPGVPHRVVLPDASRFMVDSISIDGYRDPFLYYLNPHFAQLEVASTPKVSAVPLDIRGLMKKGAILSGIRVQIGNAIPERIFSGDSIEALTTFDPGYEFSADVVLGGRAVCYFDFYSGNGTWIPPDKKRPAGRYCITVETEGPPWLLVTPLQQTPDVAAITKLVLGNERHVTLHVRNTESVNEAKYNQPKGDFDFLLHYLTSRGGIPKRLVKKTPGLDKPRSATAKDIAAALEGLGTLLVEHAAGYRIKSDVKLQLGDGMTPACSPAQYG